MLHYLLFSYVLVLSCTAPAQTPSQQLTQTILADRSLDTVYTQAKALLRKGFTAGDGYPQVWIRDFNTFLETCYRVYPKDSIRTNLLTFLKLQQPNGEIVDGYVLKGHVTWGDPNIYTSPHDPAHVGFKNTVETDQETSLIQAFAKYIHLSGDRSILQETIAGQTALQRLEQSVAYLLKNRYSTKHQLLTGATTQDWGDVQVEGGAVVDVDSNTHWAMDVYDNAMFVMALHDLSQFYPAGKDRQKWLQLKAQTATSIRKHLWDARRQKFYPHVYLDQSPFAANFDENQMYFHGGTIVAIQAGLLSKPEVVRALADMQQNVKKSGAPSIGLTLYPPYPSGVYRNQPSTEPYVYQNGGDWTWFGARLVPELVRYGLTEQAYQVLQPMVARTIRDGKFYEWYTVDNQPKGSADFKGSAGVLALAIESLQQWARQQKQDISRE